MKPVRYRYLIDWRRLGLLAETELRWADAADCWRAAALCFEETDIGPGSDGDNDLSRICDRADACQQRHGRLLHGRRKQKR